MSAPRFLAVVVIMIVIVVGSIAFVGRLVPQEVSRPQPSEPLSLVEMKGTGSGIVGVVKNNTDRDMGYVVIRFRLKDASGAQIGTTIDNTRGLEAYGLWKFRCPITVAGCKTFEVVELVNR